MTKNKQNLDTVRIEAIEIHGFRSCAHTSFSPNSELSALIGINGAGKTNILQGVRLLSLESSRRGRRLMEDLSQSPEAKINAWFNVGSKRVGLKIQFSIQPNSKRGEDQLMISESWNLQDFTDSKAWVELPPLEIFESRGAYDLIIHPNQLSFFDEKILKNPRMRGWGQSYEIVFNNKDLFRALSSINDFRQCISYYSASQFTDPTRCPSSFEVDEDGRLSDVYTPSGGTHLKFLHNLYRLRKENTELYNRYCEFVSRRQLGLVSRITWKEIELSSNTAQIKSGGEVKKIKKTKTLVIPKVQIGNAHITFNQLSEGTFKTLALIFYIFTDSSKFLMVEEPEVCVHHGLLTRVVATLKSHAKNKQTVISTHSDLLLDEIEPNQVFVVELNNNGTHVENLNQWLKGDDKAALHQYLAESGTLGEYWRSGGLS